MKKISLLFGFVLFSLSYLQAQNDFAPIGAKWHFSYTSSLGSEVGYSISESIKDTVIVDRHCQMIARTIVKKPNGIANAPIDTVRLAPFFSYAVPDTVFYYNEFYEQFLPWYIFNVQEKDTITYMVPDTQYLASHPDSLFRLLVDSVTQHIINGVLLHQIHYTPLNGYSFGGKFDGGSYFEKMGATSGPFHLPINYTAGSHPDLLRCYEDHVFSYNMDSLGNCTLIDEVTYIAKVNKKEDIVVFPNPASGMIFIKSKSLLEIKTVSIYSILGKEIISYENQGNEVSLNISKLLPDVYILKVETENGNAFKKIRIY